MASCEENLLQPLSPTSKAEFEQGSGSELQDKAKSPAKMRAVHSSSALAVNAFDYWSGEPNTRLLAALGLTEESDAVIRFEGQYPTGLPGNPPNLDVVLELASGGVIGIESKFTEWLRPKPQGKPPFKEKYFPPGIGVWTTVGLVESQRFAEKIQNGDVVFRHLDTQQLLKHALGLATKLGSGFRLFYIYFDLPGPTGDLHRSEIQLFADAVGAELRFAVMSYQELFDRLIAKKSGSSSYRSYVQSRYLQGAT